jgi:sugar phosphate permease
VSALWLVGLALALLAFASFRSESTWVNVLLLALIGALLFGPDSLLSGAAAQDAGGLKAAASATGFVNGLGSVGALLQGLIVPLIADHLGWRALFPVLVGMALLAALTLVPTFRRRTRSG